MRVMLFLSEFLVPFSLFYIIIYGFFHNVNVYECFLSGVKEGFRIVAGIAPAMIALLVSVGVFRSSGALDMICSFLRPVGTVFRIPEEIIPVLIVRIFSSSAALGFVLDIFREHGPDSVPGMMASIMMSCTETVMYTMTVYYMSVNVRKTRWTLPGALFAVAAGAAASIVITKMIC